jgi:hypothetical protein
MGDDELVLLSEAAKEIGLSAERLRQLINAGAATGEKIGDRYYVMPRHEVDRLKREPRPKPGPKGPRRPKTISYPVSGDHASARLLHAAERPD